MTTTLTVHACPPGRVRAVLNVVDTWQLADAARPEPHRLALGEPYQAFGAAVRAHEIHARLLATAPDAIWSVVDSAGADWMGVVLIQVPRLGTWTAEANQEGKTYFSGEQVAVLRSAGDRPAAAIAALLGDAWHDAVSACNPDEELVVEPRSYEVTWERSLGRIHVDGAADDGTDLELPRIAAQQRDADIDPGPADEALRAAGFVSADLWLSVASGRIQTSAVYRTADAFPAELSEHTASQLSASPRIAAG